MKKYKHIYFDLDRTLWDFEANAREAFDQIYEAFALEKKLPGVDLFIAAYNKHNEKLWHFYRKGLIKKEFLRTERFNLTLKEFGINNHILASDIGDQYMLLAPSKTNLVPGTLEVLGYLLLKNYKLYVITNGFKDVQLQKLTNCDIIKYFSKVFTSDDAGYQKPRKEIFEYALKTVNAAKNESVMVGDDYPIDIEGAKAFGIDQVFFNRDGHTNYTFKPTYEIGELRDLKNIFKG